MITKAQITKRASDEGLPAKTVERDYVLAHIVAAIAASKRTSNLIFKGGTALRLCHFQDFRYSADLDFSLSDATVRDGLNALSESLQGVNGTVSQLELTGDEPPRIAYLGPLGRPRSLKLDIADDEYVVNTERRPLLSRWADLPTGAVVHVYTPLEIAAEKLRCVLQRLQCRDLFDLNMLFQEAEVDPSEAAALFETKAEHRGYDPNIFAARYRERVTQYEKRWETEIHEHVSSPVPHFERIEREVARHLRRARML